MAQYSYSFMFHRNTKKCSTILMWFILRDSLSIDTGCSCPCCRRYVEVFWQIYELYCGWLVPMQLLILCCVTWAGTVVGTCSPGQGLDASGHCANCNADYFAKPGWAFCDACPAHSSTLGTVGASECSESLLHAIKHFIDCPLTMMTIPHKFSLL